MFGFEQVIVHSVIPRKAKYIQVQLNMHESSIWNWFRRQWKQTLINWAEDDTLF